MHIYNIFYFFFFPIHSLQAFSFGGAAGLLFRSCTSFPISGIFGLWILLPPAPKAEPVFLTPQLIGSPAAIPTFLFPFEISLYSGW